MQALAILVIMCSINVVKKTLLQLVHNNLFHVTGLFLYPLQTLKIVSVFRGYRKRPVAWSELICPVIHLITKKNTISSHSKFQ